MEILVNFCDRAFLIENVTDLKAPECNISKEIKRIKKYMFLDCEFSIIRICIYRKIRCSSKEATPAQPRFYSSQER